MPIYYFVSEGNNIVIPNRESATVPYDYWHPILWDVQAVERTFGDGDGKIYWKDVAEVMGVSSQKPHERFLLNTRFPVTSFLSVCSHFDLLPFMFLIDNNRGPERKRRNKRLERAPRAQEDLHQEIAVLQQKISSLDAAVSSLETKYKELLERNSRVEKTFAEYFGGPVGKAAEPLPEKK